MASKVTPIRSKPSVDELLGDLFAGRWGDRNCYDLNVALKLPPWTFPLEMVWRANYEAPQWVLDDPRELASWDEASRLLRELHQQYLARGLPARD
jgi:hypothetical protein